MADKNSHQCVSKSAPNRMAAKGRHAGADYQVEVAQDGSWGVFGGNKSANISTQNGTVTIQPNETVMQPVPEEGNAKDWIWYENNAEADGLAKEHIHIILPLKETMTDQQFRELYEKPELVSAMQSFLQQLRAEYVTLESDYQGSSIAVGYEGWCDLPDSFIEGYQMGMKNQIHEDEDGRTYSSNFYLMQIGATLNQQLAEQIDIGRAFESAEFAWEKGESVPVILGRAYRDYFSIGDELPMEYYLCEGEKAVVVGFLKEGTMYFGEQSTRKMDHFVLLPFFDFKNMDHIFQNEPIKPVSVLTARMFDQVILLDGISEAEYANVTQRINELLKEYHLESYYQAGEVVTQPIGF